MPSNPSNAPNLFRTTASVERLVMTNTRLAVCFSVAAAIMSEGEACAYLGLDRTTFREIYGAAERWAEDMQRNLHETKEAKGGAAAAGEQAY